MLQQPDIVAIVGENIYPDYINTLENPVMPCITICMDNSVTPASRIPVDETYYHIHGWTKNGPDEAAYLLNLVVLTIDLQPPAGLTTCRKTAARSPLYDPEARLHYFMSKWRIFASKSLLYV